MKGIDRGNHNLWSFMRGLFPTPPNRWAGPSSSRFHPHCQLLGPQPEGAQGFR